MSKSRTPVKRVKDKRVFSNTASKTKKVNIGHSPMRGGIRL